MARTIRKPQAFIVKSNRKTRKLNKTIWVGGRNAIMNVDKLLAVNQNTLLDFMYKIENNGRVSINAYIEMMNDIKELRDDLEITSDQIATQYALIEELTKEMLAMKKQVLPFGLVGNYN